MPKIEVPFGPYHPALGEPEYFQVVVDGEEIVAVDFDLGYNYREIEEKVPGFTWPKAIVLLGRICGICSSAHTQAFAYAVEEINRIEVPRRVKFIRTIGAELERIHSHLLWLGLLGESIGFDTLFMMSWGAREHALNMLEALTGKRVQYEYMSIGGVTRDIPPETVSLMKRELGELRKKYGDIRNVFLSNELIDSRLKGIAKLNKAEAEKFGVVGPTARGSGVHTDVRKDFPYSAYGEVTFKMVIEKSGDAYARALVRLEEVTESIHIVYQCLYGMPKGRVPPYELFQNSRVGRAAKTVEAPRGENFHFVIANKKSPKFVRIRPPTFANLAPIPEMMKGHVLSDVPAIINSIDPCFACTDRVVVMDIRDETVREVEM